jgi:hypothetical protein
MFLCDLCSFSVPFSRTLSKREPTIEGNTAILQCPLETAAPFPAVTNAGIAGDIADLRITMIERKRNQIVAPLLIVADNAAASQALDNAVKKPAPCLWI